MDTENNEKNTGTKHITRKEGLENRTLKGHIEERKDKGKR